MCITNQASHSFGKEADMSAVLKWVAALLLAGLAWLVTEYAVEYFRPYRKIRMNRGRF
jgi:hypothetical protein